MDLWLRLSATFHEHPKMLAVRRAAGTKPDSAELGWYRVLMAAKRYGRWTFASEEHLKHAAGPFYSFVYIYRNEGLLDHLTIHDGDSYNAVKTAAERKSEQRERDTASREDVTPQRDTQRDNNVTLQTDRQTDKEYRQTEGARDEPHIEAWLMARHHLPTQRQRDFLDRYLQVFDVTGPQRMAELILRHPNDPIAALKADLDAHREERLGEIAKWSPPPKPKPKREPWQELFRATLEAKEAETLAARPLPVDKEIA